MEPSEHDGQKERGGHESLIELVVIVATALGLALLIQAFLVKPFRIPSPSMVPTLSIGQRVLVNRVEGRWGEPDRGDIVVFKPPAGAGAEGSACGVTDGQQYAPGLTYDAGRNSDLLGDKMPCPKPQSGVHDENFIKRVVGVPGDRLKIVRGRVYVNGRQLSEPYIPRDADCLRDDTFGSDCTYSKEITIPVGHYYMMGDNRNSGASFDSRAWGPVPESQLVGKAFATYWPPRRIGLF